MASKGMHMLRFWMYVVCWLVMGSTLAAAAPIPKDLKQVVAFIYAEDDKGVWSAAGTGFFVGIADPKNTARMYGYLVTAKHVVQGHDGAFLKRVAMRLNLINGRSTLIPLPIVLEGERKTVFVHADPTVDLAVIPTFPDVSSIEYKLLPEELIVTRERFEKLPIGEGSEVFFAGLFTSHIGNERNYPIVRFGHIALLTPEKVNVNGVPTELYLMESSAYGGNSGSPVFVSIGLEALPPGRLVVSGGRNVHLIGIVSNAFQHYSPIRLLQAGRTPVVQSNIGISGVVPAYKLYELLYGDDLLRRRGAVPKQ